MACIIVDLSRLLRYQQSSLHILSVHATGAFGMELERFVPHHLLKYFFGWLEVVPAPIEWLIAFRLYLLIVQALEIRMLQTLLDSVALFRVKDQHFTEQIECYRISLWI